MQSSIAPTILEISDIFVFSTPYSSPLTYMSGCARNCMLNRLETLPPDEYLSWRLLVQRLKRLGSSVAMGTMRTLTVKNVC